MGSAGRVVGGEEGGNHDSRQDSCGGRNVDRLSAQEEFVELRTNCEENNDVETVVTTNAENDDPPLNSYQHTDPPSHPREVDNGVSRTSSGGEEGGQP